MTKFKKILLAILALIILCGAGFFWTYGSHVGEWLAEKQNNAVDKQSDGSDEESPEEAPDPRSAALDSTDLLALIPGVRTEAEKLDTGIPKWQNAQDLMGHVASPTKARLYALNTYLNDSSDKHWTAGLVFRADTLEGNPVQMLGVQALSYNDKSHAWQADGKPMLAIVSEPGGKLGYKDWEGGPTANMFLYENAFPAINGYRHSESGLIAWSNNTLILTASFLSDLEPDDGSCSVGSSTPCRKFINQVGDHMYGGDQSTNGWSPVKIQSNVITEHDNQQRTFVLKYDLQKGGYLLDDGRDPQEVDALSINRADAFIDSRASAQNASSPVQTPAAGTN